LPIPACFLYGDSDEFRESFNAHTVFSSAAVVHYKGGHSFPRSIPDEGYRELTEFVRGQYLSLLGDGFVQPAGEVYGDAAESRGDAAKI
jgi:hypothetical protein